MSEKKHIHSRGFSNPKSLAIVAAVLFLMAGLLAYVAFKASVSKPTSATPIKVAHVAITSSGFIPETLSVSAGTKVVWTNADAKPHQIQANPHPTGDSLPDLKSEILNGTQTYSYIFTKNGSVTYHDHLNPSTNGTIQIGIPSSKASTHGVK